MNTSTNVQKRTNKSKAKNEPTLVETAIARFLDHCDDKNHTNEVLFDMLHYAMESKTVDEITGFERSSLMFTYRELSLLINAIYKQKESEVSRA